MKALRNASSICGRRLLRSPSLPVYQAAQRLKIGPVAVQSGAHHVWNREKFNQSMKTFHTSYDVRANLQSLTRMTGETFRKEQEWTLVKENVQRITVRWKERGKFVFRLGALLLFSGGFVLGYVIGAKNKKAVSDPGIKTEVLPQDKKPPVAPLGKRGKFVVIDVPPIIQTALPRSAEMIFHFTEDAVKLNVCFGTEDLSSCLESFAGDDSISSLHIMGVDHQRVLRLVLQQIFIKEGISKFSVFPSFWMITINKK